MDPRLRLRHLRCFLETARLESLSAAAIALHVSQPAASKTIRELEDILGVALFDRTGRRLVLTPSGKLFQQHAGGAMLALERAQSLARNAPERVTRLVVGILPTVATDVFPRAALAFRQDMPNCTLRVSTGPNWLLLSQLREGSLDLTIGRMPNPEQMTGLAFQQLYAEQVVLVVRPDHPLTRSGATADGLGKFPLLLPPSGAVIAPAVRSYLLSIGLQHEPAAFESVSLAFGRKVVQLSDAVWFISAGVVEDEIRQGSLCALELGTSLMAGPVGICTRADTPPTPESTAMMHALQGLFPVSDASTT
ncbi:pca operon transcription factor PcaQ [Roseinatronobacter alkalisoli]|uniref:Pca operon transcription factor PcaQ n=1 Tax=Roseinatronobacter alkalisoli TaxID=3028235 RepID=A0ABT5T497_9RHOB|nr:pca operon transcription factor PcaQ [Roseinatronobacter sp. HJB301]MDD7969530.1 pca operon transcription factor PcaQ [Roseinatronobacter sp. HJB301]